MFRFAMVAMALIAFGAVLAGDNGVTYVTRISPSAPARSSCLEKAAVRRRGYCPA
jgi:hypothetical protein